ncbi:hypothetical protein ACIBJE_02195 [Micromonospora sp. NPDC050187]|uniref:hypothetical protein n=1 Tax=Micromonospora sp. NPDC050187 TaxID=3364277 RepID=UPI0037A94C8C
MAEIVRHEQHTQTIRTQPDGVTEPTTSTKTTVTVRSIHGRDVSVIRDFARALDVAGAPGTALVEISQDRLTARWTEPTAETEG